jgi:transmembrane sensor
MSPPDSLPASPAATDPPAEQARAWIAWLASGAVDEQRMQAFEHWLTVPGHRRAFEYERQLWRVLGPAGPDEARAPRRPVYRRMKQALAAAAVLALVWVAPDAWLRVQADHRTGSSVATVALPDGSAAVLDADSAIAVDYSAAQRAVRLLRGRAWFKVAPGHPQPFRVLAQGGTVEDISTAFAVGSDAHGVHTEVEQGQVRVASGTDGGWTYLLAGQRADFTREGVVVRRPDVAPDRIAAWREGELLLDAVPVADAVAQVARYRRGPTFVRGDLSGLPSLNAALRVDHPEQALDALAASAGLQVTRLPLDVVIVRAVEPAAARSP